MPARGTVAVSCVLLEAVVCVLMAETPEPPVEVRDPSVERGGGPGPPRAASGPVDEGDGPDATVTASAQLPEFDQELASRAG